MKGGWMGEVKVWAEVEGFARLGGKIEGTARISALLERVFFGVPESFLPILSLALLILCSIPTILVPKYLRFLLSSI